MSVNPLIEALLTKAHETAEKIILNAKKKVKDTLKEQQNKGGDKAREVVMSIDTKAQNDFMTNMLRKTASSEIKAKWMILEKEHALIDNVINQVRDELRLLIKKEEYLQILENLIVEGGIILEAPELEIILNERDSTLPLDMGKLGKIIGEKSSLNIKITKSAKKIEAIGGAIIQTTGGKIVVNNTFEGMLKNSESEIRYKIAQILFK
ncbi:MAG: V-type ATP synthase subunit E [Promethearchaeota archaeon]